MIEKSNGNQAIFPTSLHKQVADSICAFFIAKPEVDTVPVTNSCARGQATPESDLDMAVFLRPGVKKRHEQALEANWGKFEASQSDFTVFKAGSRFAALHLDLFQGQFIPNCWDDGGGPDN